MYTSQRQSQDTKDLRRLGGRWLKQQREAAGLSQRQLADLLDIEYYTFISQIETGNGRIPPDRYEAWAQAIGLTAAEFVREIMRYYDPVTYNILYIESGSAEAGLIQAAANPQQDSEELASLREQVRDLQRLLGKKTMEVERLREELGYAGFQPRTSPESQPL